jgi:hypothetical protein
LTSAEFTPSTRDSAFSTRRTQEAQDMPPMSKVQVEAVAVAVVIVVPVSFVWMRIGKVAAGR